MGHEKLLGQSCPGVTECTGASALRIQVYRARQHESTVLSPFPAALVLDTHFPHQQYEELSIAIIEA